MCTLTDSELKSVAAHYNEIGEKYARAKTTASRSRYRAMLNEIYEMLCLLSILHKFTVVNSTPPLMRYNG